MASQDSLLSELKQNLASNGQEHIFEIFPDMTVEDTIYKQLTSFDMAVVLERFRAAKEAGETSSSQEALEPVNDVFEWESTDSSTRSAVQELGLEAIRQGHVAAVIMSGGQGTRLGYAGPKGMYSIGLLSDKSIFQLHMERLQKVRLLAGGNASLPVFIMTSSANDSIIRKYFNDNNYFEYPSELVHFFEQALVPCLTPEGKLIVESREGLAMAPDGNGGIYQALRVSGSVDLMTSMGVRHVHVYGIDNVLTRSADPAFIGVCIERGVELANKVVHRAGPEEKVGVTAQRAGRMCVVEYSELPPSMTGADEDGKLIFSAANICNHYFSLAFLRDKVLPSIGNTYHVAHKKIPFLNTTTGSTEKPTENNGVKLEMFIFDVFPLADTWAVMEVSREEEFAPVKNAPGSASDSPDTARDLISRQSVRWLTNAGAKVYVSKGTGRKDCEVSPLLSYSGEGLDHLNGAKIELPCYLRDFKVVDDIPL
mmetsp:Transcript_1776/g.2789  ORF Transcript_1776/g.2789 Transcript_1776/m.2789 type:complete len:482 (-) Transcript_1776:202-1647(-)|eukprot:CAMPEP_0185025364 /NCGR_PEP_ID=MMETSP1103-20130426/8355_1 /TAXON_ID=36769 /ORGANISM="Paraphysomonas bandaiensis, Strain Caron Lab Isolate" /LENGTH=481 /DNA_ID=CAMNT_0027558553 /DNA_START=64 /DNA_END=1509 /DNA_ORIENTATION=+